MANSGSGSNRLTRGGIGSDSDVLSMAEGPDGFRRRSRTLKSGKVQHRYTIEIESEELLFTWADRQLGKGPAEAIKAEMQDDFNKITELAPLATRERRDRAREALARGEKWPLKQYGGGRIGTKPPTGSVRKLIDSGRLKDGLFVRENKADQTWTVNVPANRFRQDMMNPSNWQTFLEDFKRLIPSMNPRELLTREGFQNAIDDAIGMVLANALQRQSRLRAQRRSMIAGSVFSGVRSLIMP